MQRRGHGCSAEGTWNVRTTGQPDVRTTARSRPSVSPKAAARGGSGGGGSPPRHAIPSCAPGVGENIFRIFEFSDLGIFGLSDFQIFGLLDFYGTLLDLTGPYWTLLDPIGTYWTLLNPTGHYFSCPHGGRGKCF